MKTERQMPAAPPVVDAPEPGARTLPVLDLADPEIRLLGAATADVDAAKRALPGLEPSDFEDPGHRAMFRALANCVKAGVVDPYLVVAELYRLESAAGRRWEVLVADSVGAAIPLAAAPAYRRVIIDRRLRREIREQSTALVEAADKAPLPAVIRAHDRALRAVAKVLDRRSALDRGPGE